MIYYKGLRIYVVTFTPALAREWLLANTQNRILRPRDVARWRRDMTADRWRFLGDPIRRTADRVILDGQHRLEAVAESGCTVDILVVDGLEPGTQLVMDSGRKRSFADNLAIQGEPNANALAATIRYLVLWASGSPVTDDWTPTHSEMFEELERNPDVRVSTEVASHVRAALRVAARPIAAAHFRASALDRQMANEFFARLADGVGLFPGSPIYTLRERFIRAKNKSERLLTEEYAAYVVLAWNAYRDGRALSKMQLPRGGLTNSNFPEMR